ncbi:O-unit flippase-like protein [Chryseobacterium lathyri]|uniref:O-unit flippase-like protein n=1 Tax=Chryseobacterium lathyri TaxID=395933 RepID=UPI001CC07342|nr:O-unit flippase-like protein [Chryseobacterium lathyri]
MNIGRSDIVWNYLATFFKIASSALLLPVILNKMPAETVGIWTVFISITAFSYLLDFGFNPSFARNVTYVFSGVKKLQSNGFESNLSENEISYPLLKGLIIAMRWFYARLAVICLILLSILGTFYIFTLLKKYNGSHSEVYISWAILCAITSYNLYTLYYDSLLEGRGMIKRLKQINVIGQICYLVCAAILIWMNFGLIAIVSAQLLSVLIIRFFSYRSFYDAEITKKLQACKGSPQKDILNSIFPNAVKMGLTSLGGFMVTKSSLIIGSFYLTLNDIASYGITIQLVSVVSGLGSIYILTFIPKIVDSRVKNNIDFISLIYKRGIIFLLFTYFACGFMIIVAGPYILEILNSKTHLMLSSLIALLLFSSLLETNVSMAGAILVTKNSVPFFRASLLSGLAIVVGLLLYFIFFEKNVLGMILIPFIVTLVYQGWKWPYEVLKDLKIIKKNKNG